MKDILETIRDEARNKNLVFMDARSVERDSTSIKLQDGKADKLSRIKSAGIGIRVIAGDAWGFASTDRLSLENARQCLESAIKMAEASQGKVEKPARIANAKPVVGSVKAKFEIDPRSVSPTEKMRKIILLEKEARNVAPDKISNTAVNYSDGWQRETVCNIFGTLVQSESVRTSVYMHVVSREGALRQIAIEHEAMQKGFEFLRDIEPRDFSVKASKRAVSLLSAKRAPSGTFPALLHPRIVGLFTHEAFGHNAEADGVMAGISILEGKTGEKVASELITIVDDASPEGVWGSYRYDSEGTPAVKKVLVDKGVAKEYMHSLETAAEFGVEPNGSARAQDFDCRPVVRMSNTSIEPGKQSFDELIKGIDYGIMLSSGLNGYVLPDRGQFTFHAGEGWIIRKGEIAEQTRDVYMSGLLLETLKKIDGVSREHEMPTMNGFCGKDGQLMYVSAGGPYVRVEELMIGGQE